MSTTRQSPSIYRKLSEPFDNADNANTAVEQFLDELYELRVKYRIRDVHVCIAGNCSESDGSEMEFFSGSHFGDQLQAERMLAHALGSTQRERQESIGRLTKGVLKRHADRP